MKTKFHNKQIPNEMCIIESKKFTNYENIVVIRECPNKTYNDPENIDAFSNIVHGTPLVMLSKCSKIDILEFVETFNYRVCLKKYMDLYESDFNIFKNYLKNSNEYNISNYNYNRYALLYVDPSFVHNMKIYKASGYNSSVLFIYFENDQLLNKLVNKKYDISYKSTPNHEKIKYNEIYEKFKHPFNKMEHFLMDNNISTEFNTLLYNQQFNFNKIKIDEMFIEDYMDNIEMMGSNFHIVYDSFDGFFRKLDKLVGKNKKLFDTYYKHAILESITDDN